MNSQRRKPLYLDCDGFLIPPSFSKEKFRSALKYQAERTDIFIATYPKCGTTWTQNIVWLLDNNGIPFPPDKLIQKEMPFLELVGSDFVRTLPSPRFIKVHLPFSLTPYHPESKYIYVARNPFDCAVSFYHHSKSYDFAEGTFDDFFECFMTGEVIFGDYFDNLLSWYEHKDDPNILFLTYEEIKINIRQQISKIAYFLGNKYNERVNNPEILNKILHHSSFKSMSMNQERWSDNITSFIRKGEVGDWKNYFSGNQIKRLRDKFLEKTSNTNLKIIWSQIIPI